MEMKTFLYAILCCLFTNAIAADKIDYHTDIAPIFRDYCGGCHNETDYDGEFSIETFRAVMEGGESGKTIITPGDVKKSYLADLVLGNAKRPMPPSKDPQLSEEQIDTITKWIAQGANGPVKEKDLSILATLTVPEIAANPDVKKKPITAAEHAPDGTLATATYGKIKYANWTFPVEGKVYAIHFSTDGSQMVVASGTPGLSGLATLWDTKSGQKIRTFGKGVHRDILYDAELSPDGTILATAGYDRIIRLWDSKTGKQLRTIEGHNGAVFDLAFSPNGKLLASASADETGKIWRVSDGYRLDTLNQPEGEQFRIDFTPDGKYVVCSGADKKIRLWRLISTDKRMVNPILHARFAHESTITEMTISPDGKLLATASADKTVKTWSLPDLQQIQSFSYSNSDLVSLARFASNQQLWLARMDGAVEQVAVVPAGDDHGQRTVYTDSMYTVHSRFSDTEANTYTETEQEILSISLPATIAGAIETNADTDSFRFRAKKGDSLVLEVEAARKKSPLDSKIEVLTADGEPLERVVLQAVRDSWFTFRGKDSNTSDDFRVHNWEEMELNEYLYASGEVVKLWHYPRGPDSGFRVYPGYGNRITYFDTTPLSHPLGGPCYIVQAFAAGSQPKPNGLPVYRLHWENDDSGDRMLGSDSRLHFVAPADGDYIARISDVRGYGGTDYKYSLAIRAPKPDFTVSHNGGKTKIAPGSGKEIEFKATRIDKFKGEIRIEIENLPAGFFSYPITIQPEQGRAYLTIHAAEDAVSPKPEEVKKIKISATGNFAGKEITKAVAGFTEFALGSPAKLKVNVFADGNKGKMGEDSILEITVRPGETVSALVRAERIDHKGQVTFGKDDSGRNLPHGVYVDNIGLNGLMIPDGQEEQRFWITAAKWVPQTERLFHLRAEAGDRPTTKPIRVIVK